MLCAACLAMFAGPYTGTQHDGLHHHLEANLERAAKNGCYLCSELLLEYVESKSEKETNPGSLTPSIDGNFHTQRRLEERGTFTTFHLRQSTRDYGDLYFWFEEIQSSSATFFLIRNHAIQEPPDYDQYMLAARLDLSSVPWQVRDDGLHLFAHLSAISTGEPEIAEVASTWLTNCLRRHSACNSFASSGDIEWVPSRLIDVDGDEPKLILTAQTPPTGRYATLSHCWGPNPSICCLDANNAHAWQSSISPDMLTQTFRDAIVTTKRLGIRYLWIDSLCILQAGPGSDEDWLEHAVVMRSIYRNSILNIAVARASSGEDGAFAPREPALVRPCHFRWMNPPLTSSSDLVIQASFPQSEAATVSSFAHARCSEYQQTESSSRTVHVGEKSPFWTIRSTFRHSSAALRTLPLYTRAWVVQERFLAPRVLHFGNDRIMWECSELHFAEESCPGGITDYFGPDWQSEQWPFNVETVNHDHHLQETRDYGNTDPMREVWHDMIDEFTRCDLSFPDKDIFVAFAGVAEVFGQHYDHQYVAGFFRQHLPFALWWRNKGVRSQTKRAPSWSWASINGPVQTGLSTECPFCDHCCARLAHVEDVQINLVDNQNVYGQIKGAQLTLRGWLIPCRVEILRQGGTGLARTVALFPGMSAIDQFPTSGSHERGEILGDAELEEDEESQCGSESLTHSTCDRWALPLFLAKEAKVGIKSLRCRHFGLIVRKNEDGRYSRVGLYSVRGNGEPQIAHKGQAIQRVCLV